MGAFKFWYRNKWRLFEKQRPIDITAATVTIDSETHQGRQINFNKADGITATLPAALGTGDEYEIVVKTTLTSSGIIQVASADDVMAGAVLTKDDAGSDMFATAATSDTITLNGTTTGGLVGTQIRLRDIAPGVWAVQGTVIGSGVGATPFSAAVS